MGIVNITSDSFFDGGKYASTQEAIDQGVKLAGQGADILDIGAESSRPFAVPVSQLQELTRVLPVISNLKKKFWFRSLLIPTSLRWQEKLLKMAPLLLMTSQGQQTL